MGPFPGCGRSGQRFRILTVTYIGDIDKGEGNSYATLHRKETILCAIEDIECQRSLEAL